MNDAVARFTVASKGARQSASGSHPKVSLPKPIFPTITQTETFMTAITIS